MQKYVNKSCFFLLVLLISAPGCWGGKKKKIEPAQKTSTTEVFKEINIPVAGDDIKSFFDEDIEEFVLIDNAQENAQKVAQQDIAQVQDDFSWVEEVLDTEFKTVYFGFDRYDVAAEQQGSVEKDIRLVKDMIAKGETPTIVIEGHACHSAGSRTYNLALSEKRAKSLADRLVAAGVPRENIKVVARGSEVPALDKSGKPVTGDKEQQWPNRRDEIRVINS